MNNKIYIDTERFLMLAVKAAKANGIVVEEEKELLRRYSKAVKNNSDLFCNECPDDSSVNIETLTAYFESLTAPQKKRILFEILDVMYADHLFDESECNFVYDLASRIGIEEAELNRIFSLYESGYQQKQQNILAS